MKTVASFCKTSSTLEPGIIWIAPQSLQCGTLEGDSKEGGLTLFLGGFTVCQPIDKYTNV